MSTVPYRLQAWKVINGEVNRKLAERLEPVRAALALIERAEGDIAAGWPEAALDCLGRARRLLERCTQRDRR